MVPGVGGGSLVLLSVALDLSAALPSWSQVLSACTIGIMLTNTSGAYSSSGYACCDCRFGERTINILRHPRLSVGRLRAVALLCWPAYSA